MAGAAKTLATYEDLLAVPDHLVAKSAQTLEVNPRADPLWSLVAAFGGDTVARVEPFDAIELELGSMWPVVG